jgi:hypothetical protein
MKVNKSIWSTVGGGLTSAFPILFACCKGGACVGVCVTPVASLFGISAATIAASPLTNILEPLFIALSAISFTVSYYALYVLPKFACNTGNSCDCQPNAAEERKIKISKLVFWLGIILSIGFISYFEYSKYNSAVSATYSPVGCSPDAATACAAPCDSTSCGEAAASECSAPGEACCEKESEVSASSTITCPKCGFEKEETMPTEVCQLKYTCTKCSTVMLPKESDCCVFCSYGDHKCPSKQDFNGHFITVKPTEEIKTE